MKQVACEPGEGEGADEAGCRAQPRQKRVLDHDRGGEKSAAQASRMQDWPASSLMGAMGLESDGGSMAPRDGA